jgi:short-subunit dehydrogenase
MKSKLTQLSIFVFLLSVLTGCVTHQIGRADQKKVSGKTFVIVGASSGIGKGVAEKLGSYHANVVLAARRTELLDEIATAVKTAGGKALVVTTDVTDSSQLKRLADVAQREFGKVDVWINNAGVGSIGKFWEIPLAVQSSVVDVNLKGVIYGSYVAVNLFRKQGYGTIINTGSVDSETPLAYQGAYSASKAGVLNLSQLLNQELRLNGYNQIKVVTIMPWATDTPWWRHAANYSGGTPRMAAMDGPEKSVNAIIRKSLRPKRHRVKVGWKTGGSNFFHKIFPVFTERMSANIAHKYQIENAPPDSITTGAVFKPMKAGQGVDDGVRPRIKKEKKMKAAGR